MLSHLNSQLYHKYFEYFDSFNFFLLIVYYFRGGARRLLVRDSYLWEVVCRGERMGLDTVPPWCQGALRRPGGWTMKNFKFQKGFTCIICQRFSLQKILLFLFMIAIFTNQLSYNWNALIFTMARKCLHDLPWDFRASNQIAGCVRWKFMICTFVLWLVKMYGKMRNSVTKEWFEIVYF